MHKVWLIASRELKARLFSRSFLLMAILGPILVLIGTYLLFALSGTEKKHYNVLIMDKMELMDNRLMPQKDPLFNFDFVNAFVDYDEFANLDKFQNYDLSVWVNEKVFTNKTVIISYRERPTENVIRRLSYHIERRLEELMIAEFTELDIKEFRAIKQPLNFTLKNTYDPKSEAEYRAGWVGYFFGALIITFIFLFGMTMLRSVVNDKSNRIVEILLSSVSPKTLLSGKIIGVGLSAVFQFAIWTIFIAVGLFVFRQLFFPDIFDPSIVATQVAEGLQSSQESNTLLESYNEYVELIYRQIHFLNMIIFFLLFFIGGFLFYGAFFAAIGASMGSESDGQQFIIPLVLLMLLVLFSGYYSIYYPELFSVKLAKYIPFSSPVAMMIQLGFGFSEGESWQLFFSLFILYLSAILMLMIASKIYQHGILSHGHKISLKRIIQFLRQ